MSALPYLTGGELRLRESEGVEACGLFSTYRGILFGVYIFFVTSSYLRLVLRLRDMDPGGQFFFREKLYFLHQISSFIVTLRLSIYRRNRTRPNGRGEKKRKCKNYWRSVVVFLKCCQSCFFVVWSGFY